MMMLALLSSAGGPVISFVPYVGDDLAAGRRIIAEQTNFGAAVVRTTVEAPYGTGKGCLQAFFAEKQVRLPCMMPSMIMHHEDGSRCCAVGPWQ